MRRVVLATSSDDDDGARCAPGSVASVKHRNLATARRDPVAARVSPRISSQSTDFEDPYCSGGDASVFNWYVSLDDRAVGGEDFSGYESEDEEDCLSGKTSQPLPVSRSRHRKRNRRLSELSEERDRRLSQSSEERGNKPLPHNEEAEEPPSHANPTSVAKVSDSLYLRSRYPGHRIVAVWMRHTERADPSSSASLGEEEVLRAPEKFLCFFRPRPARIAPFCCCLPVRPATLLMAFIACFIAGAALLGVSQRALVRLSGYPDELRSAGFVCGCYGIACALMGMHGAICNRSWSLRGFYIYLLFNFTLAIVRILSVGFYVYTCAGQDATLRAQDHKTALRHMLGPAAFQFPDQEMFKSALDFLVGNHMPFRYHKAGALTVDECMPLVLWRFAFVAILQLLFASFPPFIVWSALQRSIVAASRAQWIRSLNNAAMRDPLLQTFSGDEERVQVEGHEPYVVPPFLSTSKKPEAKNPASVAPASSRSSAPSKTRSPLTPTSDAVAAVAVKLSRS